MSIIYGCLVFIFLHGCYGIKFNTTELVVKEACRETMYNDVCIASMSEFTYEASASDGSNAAAMCEAAMKAASPGIQNVKNLVQDAMGNEQERVEAVLQMCGEVLSDAYDALDWSIGRIEGYRAPQDGGDDDVWTWMSGVVTHHTVCMEELQNLAGSCPPGLLENAQMLHMILSNSLALVVYMRRTFWPPRLHGQRKLLKSDLGLPSWIPPSRRRHLLQDSAASIIVAQDGTGSFSSIQQAVDSASPGSVIYVKKGVYHEYVLVYPNKTNLVIMGDGIDQTIISGNLSFAQVGTTYKTSTLSIKAFGFIGKYLTIENTAGPENNQAVALLVNADQVAFYRCSFLAYQDTLYAFAYRQFYRECHIEGTVDFIFGNAAAVFQQCTMWARQNNDDNFVTAQGRTDPNQNTGLSVQQCYVDGSSETYLGRPWRNYSLTVFMQTNLTSIVSPYGWAQWGDAYARDETVFYVEYENFGDGAYTTSRVSWSRELSMDEASQFTVGTFIGGDEWLPSTGISYQTGLY